jgi:hypothetical protein
MHHSLTSWARSREAKNGARVKKQADDKEEKEKGAG